MVRESASEIGFKQITQSDVENRRNFGRLFFAPFVILGAVFHSAPETGKRKNSVACLPHLRETRHRKSTPIIVCHRPNVDESYRCRSRRSQSAY